jgi:chromosome segregation ATPase
MPKANKKTVDLEENEFLKELIDEVNAIEHDTGIELGDDSDTEAQDQSSCMELAIGQERPEKGRADILGQVYDRSTHVESDQMPTAFANLNADLKKSVNEAPPKPLQKPVTSHQDQTVGINDIGVATEAIPQGSQVDRTIAVEGAKNSQKLHIYQEKSQVVAQRPSRQGQAYVAADASLAQAETLKVAQERIHELEAEVDYLRKDNDDLASAGEIITQKMEGLQSRALRAEKEKNEVISQFKNEVLILKGHLQYKESELSKAKTKIEELDSRIKTDFKKIRVRERELENRLELVRAEKQTLMRSKDDRILDLQRKVDQFKSELDLYRTKVQDLNKTMEDQQDQMRKTVRALRVALSNLEQESPIDDMSVTEAENNDKEKAE